MFSWSVKLYSTTLFNIYNTNIVWIVFQEKYEIFRHLIINSGQCGQVRF